jgi:flagellar motility protein MotE (MotC chaperone)
VITDKTLPQYARKGQITVADPKEKKGAAPAAAATTPAAEQGTVRDEAYWRNRALEIRLRWRQADDDVKELEQRSTELRQRFYSETDDFVRNNQVKPEWDRVLDRLRQARTDVDAAKQDLAQLHEEGRMAGALPGWLREGEDQEPTPDPEKEKLPAPQSIEPPVLNDDGGEEARK